MQIPVRDCSQGSRPRNLPPSRLQFLAYPKNGQCGEKGHFWPFWGWEGEISDLQVLSFQAHKKKRLTFLNFLHRLIFI